MPEAASGRRPSTASCAGSRWRPSTRICSSRRAGKLVCSCDACAVLFSGRAGGPVPARAARRRVVCPTSACPTPSGRTCTCRSTWRSSSQSTPAGRVLAFYPSPAGRRRIAADARGLAGPGRRESRPRASSSPTSRRSWSTGSEGERAYYRAPIDECYKLVGLIRAHWRGLSGGTEVWDEVGRFFAGLKRAVASRGEESRRAGSELRGRAGRAPSRTPRRRSWSSSCGSPRRRGRRADDDPGRRPALPDPHRADPPALCAGRSRSGSSTCSASPSAGARRSAACSGLMPASSSRRLPAAPSSIFRCRARSTSTWPRPSTFTHWKTARSRSALLFSGTIFYTTDDGFLQVSQIPWEKEATFRLPVPVWKEMMELYYPNSAWLCLRPRRLRSALPLQEPASGFPTWEQALETLLDCQLRGGRVMNQALVDQIASAVLYEGYILYPYRPSVKNRQRWTFGGLVPPAYSQAQGGTEPWEMQTECLVLGGPGTTLTVSVRFLAARRPAGRRVHPTRSMSGRPREPFPARSSSRCGSAMRSSTPGKRRSSRRSTWANRALATLVVSAAPARVRAAKPDRDRRAAPGPRRDCSSGPWFASASASRASVELAAEAVADGRIPGDGEDPEPDAAR